MPELLDQGLRLYLDHFGALFVIPLLTGLIGWVLVFTGHRVPVALPPQAPALFRALTGGGRFAPPIWGSLVSAAVTLLGWATLLFLAGRAAAGMALPPLPQAAAAGLRRLWPLLVTSLVVGLVGAVGVVLLIVPGVFLLTRWTVAPVLAVVEERRASAALGRSYALVRGLFWHTLGASLLGSLVSAVALLALTVVGLFLAPLHGALGLELRALWQVGASALIGPYVPCVLVLLAADLRTRKEGSDLGGSDLGGSDLGGSDLGGSDREGSAGAAWPRT